MFDGLELALTYECGEDKIIQLRAEKGLCRRNAEVVGTVLTSYHLDATAEISNGLYWDNKPGVITWTLTDSEN